MCFKIKTGENIFQLHCHSSTKFLSQMLIWPLTQKKIHGPLSYRGGGGGGGSYTIEATEATASCIEKSYSIHVQLS